jgi:addiction module HigA family antidote
MKNPPHPGETIREDIIEALGLTVTRAADILGVRRATLSDVTHGKAAVSSEMALRLEKAFGVSMDLLLKMQAGYDAAQARLHGNQIKVKRWHGPNSPLMERQELLEARAVNEGKGPYSTAEVKAKLGIK